jgi:hypothetical protein
MSNQIKSEVFSQENKFMRTFTLECVMDMFIKQHRKIPNELIMDLKKVRLPNMPQQFKDAINEMKELNKDNEDVKKEIKRQFNFYRHQDKYYGEGHHKIQVLTNGDNGDSIDQELKQFLGEKMKAKAFTYNRRMERLTWLDAKDIQSEFKRFKGLIKQGVLKVQECNNKTVTMENNKQEWYSIVIQHADDSQVGMDLAGVKIFQFFVDGVCYFFTNKKNRDAMYKYLVK